MKETISKLMANWDGMLMMIAVAVICLNTVLTALKKVLERIKDKTKTQLDDKAAVIVDKVLKVSIKVLEFASANSTALPPKARAEIESAKAEDKAA